LTFLQNGSPDKASKATILLLEKCANANAKTDTGTQLACHCPTPWDANPVVLTDSEAKVFIATMCQDGSCFSNIELLSLSVQNSRSKKVSQLFLSISAQHPKLHFKQAVKGMRTALHIELMVEEQHAKKQGAK